MQPLPLLLVATVYSFSEPLGCWLWAPLRRREEAMPHTRLSCGKPPHCRAGPARSGPVARKGATGQAHELPWSPPPLGALPAA